MKRNYLKGWKMKLASLTSVFAVMLIAGQSQGGMPTEKDISFDAKGQLVIKGWLETSEDYTVTDSAVNKVFSRGDNSVTYGNEHLLIKKRVSLERNKLKLFLHVIPRTEQGRTSDFFLHVRFKKPFQQFYMPYAYSSPKISGRFIKAAEMANIEEGYVGACTNSMRFSVFIGKKASLMFDRVSHGGFKTYGGPSWVSGDLKEMTFPLFGYHGHIGWNPGQLEPDKTWRGNVYNPVYEGFRGGGQLELDLTFIPTGEAEKAQKLAGQQYFQARRDLEENEIFPDWSEYVRPPEKRPAFCAFVSGTWAGGLAKIGNSWAVRLRNMRRILDENGLADEPIYFWVMLYAEERSSGWGKFPLDDETIKKFYANLRTIHDLKLGVYVNYWCSSVEAEVYKKHPEWFTTRSQKCDGGDDGYWGRLPEWSKYLADEMPKLVKAYDLDFIFFDNAGPGPIVCGSVKQTGEFARGVVESLHKAGAFAAGNGRGAFLDVQYFEVEAGKSPRQDADWAENFHYMSSRDWILGPEISRTGAFFEESYKAFLKWYAPHPQFSPRFPVHYGGELHNQMMEKAFKPYVKILAARKAKK